MAFIVEDGSGVALANSYATVAEFQAYHTDRGNDYSAYGGGDIQKALVRACDYLDTRFTFVGCKRARSQTMEWPRIDAFDRDDYMISGVPIEVKEAAMEYALIALGQAINPIPDRSATGQVISSKSERVDVLSEATEYASGDSFTLPRYPAADMKLTRAGIVVSGLQIRRGD